MFVGGTKLLLAAADNCWVLLGLLHSFCFYSSRCICIGWENAFW